MTPTFRCGHPKSPANSWSLGNGFRRCKTCHQIRKAKGRQEAATDYVSFLRPKPPLDLSGDPDVQRYRAEKARRSAEAA